MDDSSPNADGVERLTAVTGDGGVGQRTGRGAVYVASGQTLLRLVGIVGGVCLARLLSPRDFGIYSVTAFMILQLGALADLGLGAKLIHDVDPPSLSQKRSIFTFHCAAAVVIYGVFYWVAPLVSRLFLLGHDGVAFGRALGLVILIYPFRPIPSALLNRGLQFGPLAVAEVTGGVLFQVAAVTLAFLGFSYWSFGAAFLLSAAVRTLVVNAYCPWRPGLAWDGAYLRRCLRFGGAFQLSTLTSVVRDNLNSILGGPFFGPTAVGLLSWAYRLASYGSQTYVGICANVSFPSLSRLRSDPQVFDAALTKMLRYVNLATFLSLSVVVALASEVVHLVFTDKWTPAIPLFYYFAVRMVACNYTTMFDLGLKAQGHPERSLKIVSAWTAWEIGLAAVGALMFGYAGIAISSAVGAWLAAAWLYRELSRHAPINFWHSTRTPALGAAVTLVILHWGKGQWIGTLPRLGLAIIAGALVYLGVCFLAEGSRFLNEIKADLGELLGRKRVTLGVPARVAP